MKSNIIRTAAFIFMLIILAGSSNLFAQTKSTVNGKRVIPEKAVKNYEQCLNSEIEGIKLSAIYFAGFYQIDELEKPLEKLLANEQDTKIKTFINMALFMIRDREPVIADQSVK